VSYATDNYTVSYHYFIRRVSLANASGLVRLLMLFDHYNEIPVTNWPYRYFKPHEIACKGTGQLLVNAEAISGLDNMRSLLGHPIRLSSAFRSVYHNSKIGGAPLSVHSVKAPTGAGSAFDIVLEGRDKETIRQVAEQCGFKGFGMRYRTFIHIDMGRRRQW
jgi:zinc D-Ala-D-Ala carboxypeptidase